MYLKKNSIILTTILTSLITFTVSELAIALPERNKSTSNRGAHSSKKNAKEDRVPVLDLSKPAFFTPKATQWGQAPEILPPGASLAILEGDPAQAGPFTIRLKLPANYEFPSHWCSMDEHISVISGHLYLGMGDKIEKNKSTSFPAGSFARIPLKMHHYAWTTEETIIQLHGTGPWIIGYANPQDDPTHPEVPATPETVDLDILNDRDDLDLKFKGAGPSKSQGE